MEFAATEITLYFRTTISPSLATKTSSPCRRNAILLPFASVATPKNFSSIGGGGGGPDTGRAKRPKGGVDNDTGMGVGSSSLPNQKEVDGGSPSGSAPVTSLIVSWRSALAFRQAVAKAKFGDEAATSPDAKKMVDEEPKFYLVMISGLSGRALRNEQIVPRVQIISPADHGADSLPVQLSIDQCEVHVTPPSVIVRW